VKAIDTNVVARYLLNDDPNQSPLAMEQLRQPCFISDTVLLECAWLMSSRYGVGRAELVATIRDLLALPNVTVSDEALISWAVDRFAAGADFADMLHLVTAKSTQAFVTFERHLSRDAGPQTPVAVELLR
jgi:predicted nucleic-acid-binding protein